MATVLVYVLSTALTVGLAAWLSRNARLRKFFPLAAIPLLLVSVARWRVGTDFAYTYLPEYRAMEHVVGVGKPAEKVAEYRRFLPKRSKHHVFGKTPSAVQRHFVRAVRRSEPTQRFLLWAAVKSGIGIRLVTGANAVIALLLIFWTVGRQSRWPALGALFFVLTGSYFLSLNVIRQFTAIAIGLAALPFVVDRRPWSFLAAVAAASAFHYSALILLPVYGLSRIALTPGRGIALVGVSLCLGGLAAPLLEGGLLQVGLSHYAKYFRSYYAREGFEWILFAINACFLAMGAWYWKPACSGNRLFALWYGLTVLGTVALAVSGTVPLMKRVNYYYAAPQFLMLPELLMSEENPCRRRILTIVVIGAFALEAFVSVCLLNKNGVLPYRIS